MLLEHASIEKSFKEEWALVDFLPYDDVKEGVFIQVDGSLGRVWEIQPLETELLSTASLEMVANAFSGLVGRIPAEVACQMIMVVTHDVKQKTRMYEKVEVKNGDALSEAVAAAKVKSLEEKKEKASSKKQHAAGARSVRIFFSIRSFSEGKKESRGAFLSLSHAIESQFKAMSVGYVPVEEQALLEVLYRLLNPRRAEMLAVKVDERTPLREQVLYNAPLSTGEGFVFEGVATRVLTLKDLPAMTTPGMFVPSGLGLSLLDLPGAFLFAFNFTVPDQAKEMEKIKFQKAFAFLQRKSSTGDVSEEAEEKKEELGAVITDLFRGGKAIVRARTHVVLFNALEEQLERACDMALSVFHRLGAGALKEEIIAPSLLLTCLPLNFDHRLEPFIRRSRRLFSDNLADMLPVYGALQGTGTPAAMYLNRRGEPVFIDFFDSPTNPHAVVLGASGAGSTTPAAR